jgi:hypothetical protein
LISRAFNAITGNAGAPVKSGFFELLSERPGVRIAPGTPSTTPQTCKCIRLAVLLLVDWDLAKSSGNLPALAAKSPLQHGEFWRSMTITTVLGTERRDRMNNIVSYAQTEFRSVEEWPLTEVDSLILSWLVYLHYPPSMKGAYGDGGMRLQEIFQAEHFDELLFHVYDRDSTMQLLTAVCGSPRFRGMTICDYVEENDASEEKQFAACTFRLPNDRLYIAFRGTDSTVLGWHEDFNMAFKCPVASQSEASRYLSAAAQKFAGDILLGGHSKGGNLAVYAAYDAAPPVQSRIRRVYSHDGPGFLPEVLQSARFKEVQAKIYKTIPQSSTIGMLLEEMEAYHIIKSTNISFWQHNPFSWVVEDGAFVPISELTKGAKLFDQSLSDWVRSLSVEERKTLADTLFDIIGSTDVTTVKEIGQDWQHTLPALLKATADLDDNTRAVVFAAIRLFFAVAVKELPEVISPGKG